MSDLDRQLKQLIAQACASPVKSPERQMHLQTLHRKVMQSEKLWSKSVPYYNDALHDMWMHCFQHLEEYDPNMAGVITWLNTNLKRILERYRYRWKQDKKIRYEPNSSDDRNSDPIGIIPSKPNVSPLLEMWQKTVEWVRTDPEGVLRKTCFRKRADINAQALILRRFPDKIPWKTIAAQFALSPEETTDLPKFYSRHCHPLLRAFGKAQGYLDP